MIRRKLKVKNKTRAVRRIGLLVLALVLAAGAVTAAVLLLRSAGTFSSLKELPFTAESVYEYTGTGFLYVENKKLFYCDNNDEKKNYSVELSAPDVMLAGSPSITAVYNGYAMQIVGAEYPIEFSGQVRKVRCGGEFVAVLKSENGAETLQIFNGSGTQVDQISFESSFLIDFGFYTSESEILWTLSMETSGSEPISTITTYDLTKSATTGVINIQSHLIEEIKYSRNSLFVADTNHLTRFNPVRNNESWRIMIYGWRLADSIIADKPYFLLIPRGATSLSTVKLLSVKEGDIPDETESVIHLPVNTVGAYLCSDKLIAVTPNEILTHSTTGNAEGKAALETTVDRAEKLDSAHILLQSGSKLFIVTIK
ncbi:MAG: hypothetical protein BWY11_00395 [Firmicutes bacterium ADurb.Bin182]|nr:MAG: hypothetical protein BWY11_00395 [Firmicutes bacterium ADurb.Bin182]